MRGCCIGFGRNVTSSIRYSSPSYENGSPLQSPARTSRPSSSFRARIFLSVSSPNTPNSVSGGLPSPTPNISLPSERWSRDTVARATCHGRRRASGVTIAPMRTRSVRMATADNATHGSANGSFMPSHTWSHVNTPSHPACSASYANSAMNRGSANSSNGGKSTPCFTIVSSKSPSGHYTSS